MVQRNAVDALDTEILKGITMRTFIVLCFAILLAACGGSSSPKLESIELTLTSYELAVGDTASATVRASYSDGSQQTLPITNVTLTSSSTSVATVNQGVVRAVSEGQATITATFEDVTAQKQVTVRPAEARSLIVSDTSISLPLGLTYQFEVKAKYSDNSEQTVDANFGSYNTAIIEVDSNGLLSTVSEGQTSVVVSFNSIETTVNVAVTAAEPTSINLALSPMQVAAGFSSTATVQTTYTDGTVADTTADAEITVEESSDLVEITGSQIDTFAPGTVVIKASYAGLDDQETLTITDAVTTDFVVNAETNSVPKGLTLALNAEAYYSDGSVVTVTNDASWSVGSESIAIVSSAGVITAVDLGTTTIYASFDGFSADFNVTVTEALLTSINVIPVGTYETYEGGSFYATAEGTYTDNSVRDITAEVTWSSTDNDIATVSNHSSTKGRVQAVSPGEVDITASLASETASFKLTVRELALVSIEVRDSALQDQNRLRKAGGSELMSAGSWAYMPNANHPDLPEGRTRQLYAIGTFEDGSVADVTGNITWSIGDTTVAQFVDPQSQPGLVRARATGVTNVTAMKGEIQGTYQLNVVDAVLETLNFTHDWTDVFVGDNAQAQVMGIYSDGGERDVTDDVSWQSSNSAVLAVSNQSGQQGRITGVAAGSATITASLDGVSQSQVVEVRANVIESVSVSSTSSSVYRARTMQFTATGTMTSGTEVDLTNLGNWHVDNVAFADIDGSGQLMALDAGTVSVTFTSANGVTDTMDVVIKAISEMADQFTRSLSVSASIINGVVQQGSRFTYIIGNNTGENLELIEFRVNDATRQMVSTTNQSLLNDGVINHGESHGLTWTVPFGGATMPITLTFMVRDPLTGESFAVSRIYN